MNTQTALITGASSGIGLELARVFAKNGYNLVLTARTEDVLQTLRHELALAHAVTVTVIPADLTEPGACQALFDKVKADDIQIDVLVNDAGQGILGKFWEVEWDKLSRIIQLNVVALTELTHLFLPGMIAHGKGHIMNVASIAGFIPGPLMAVYNASKGFVLLLTEALAQELKSTGVHVTALCPGPTETNFATNAGMGSMEEMHAPGAKEVAEFGFRAMQKGEVVAIHGLGNSLFINALVRLLPRETMASLIGNFNEQARKEGPDTSSSQAEPTPSHNHDGKLVASTHAYATTPPISGGHTHDKMGITHAPKPVVSSRADQLDRAPGAPAHPQTESAKNAGKTEHK
jgi:uncharacterized protein